MPSPNSGRSRALSSGCLLDLLLRVRVHAEQRGCERVHLLVRSRAPLHPQLRQELRARLVVGRDGAHDVAVPLALEHFQCTQRGLPPPSAGGRREPRSFHYCKQLRTILEAASHTLLLGPDAFEGGHQGGRHELIAALAHDASLAAQEWTKHVRRVAAARQRRDSTRIVRRGHAQVPGRIALDIHGQLEPLLRAHHGRTEPESLRGAEKERKNVDRQHHALKT
mmetsp:Transcript_19586/g.63763  ORF Transcript_19586/g.63763 Transcript_19586/m.63763 type:complete len:223 (+) Transcript_19586:262-930(+)